MRRNMEKNTKSKQLTNEDYLKINISITQLIDAGTKKTYQISEKGNPNAIMEVKEVLPAIEIPNEVSYPLITSRAALAPIVKESDEIMKRIQEEVKESLISEGKKEDPKFTEKDIDIQIYTHIVQEKMYEKGSLYKIFLDETPSVHPVLKTVKISLDKSNDSKVFELSKIDPKKQFKLNYIPELVLENIIKII